MKRHFRMFLSDLNSFKVVNDTLGHPEGDKVLKKFGELLDESFKRENGELSLGLSISGAWFDLYNPVDVPTLPWISRRSNV